MKKIIVIGAGASGLMAAITAAENGASVTILEGMDRPGKKILMTGNGRCNLTNLDSKLTERYHSKSKQYSEMTKEVFSQFGTAKTLEFFHGIGLLTTDRQGYVYPFTNQAAAVLDLLLAEAKRLRVKLKFSEKVTKIVPFQDGWSVATDSWHYECDAVILCSGSKAAPITGSDGSGYQLAKNLGHEIVPVYPALTALTTTGKFASLCEGVRCQANISLQVRNSEDTNVYSEQGELQWTKNGISGIAVFQLSRYVPEALKRNDKVTVLIDCLPDVSVNGTEVLVNTLLARYKNASISEALAGLLPKKLLLAFLQDVKIKPGCPCENCKPEQIKLLLNRIKQLTLQVTGTRSFEQCQVCSGGISLDQVNPVTLESALAKQIYFAGELLDIDGPCGGYNLQWAWSSGYTAGYHAAGR